MKHFTILLAALFLFVIACDENVIFDPCEENIWYIDLDGDGFGTGNAVSIPDCTDTEGYANNNTDCDDTDATVTEEATYYRDMDSDGFGNAAVDSLSCGQPNGYVINNIDCDDEDADSGTAQNYYVDNDEDGYGAGEVIVTCEPAANYVDNNLDCDDNNAEVWEGQTWYQDADGDGLGNPDVSQYTCEQPNGYVGNSNDEDDTVFDETGIIADFNEHFFGHLWYTSYDDPEGFNTNAIWGANSSEIFEGVELPLGPPEFESEVSVGDLWYEISPNNENQLLLTSNTFNDFYGFEPYDDTIIITLVSEGVIDYLINGEIEAKMFRKEFRENCLDNDRIFNAEWLVANNQATREYLTRDSIKLTSTVSMIGQPLNQLGMVTNTEYPDDVDNFSFVDFVGHCNDIYFALDPEFETTFEGQPHALSNTNAWIDGNELVLGQDEQFRLLIIDP